MRYILLLPLLCVLFSGCRTVCFDVEPPGDFTDVTPAAVLDNFSMCAGESFEGLESAVFQFFGRSFTGLGYISVNQTNNSFAMTLMNPAGIKFLELRGVGADIEELFVPPDFGDKKNELLSAVAGDIRQIYFDLKPDATATHKLEKSRLVSTVESDAGKVRYIYSGMNRYLTEKRVSRGWRTLSRVRYFMYKTVDGKIYPHGIILENKRYKYRLILRVKYINPVS